MLIISNPRPRRLPNGHFWYKLFGYFAPNAAHAPSGHYFGPKATLMKPFHSDGFPATVLISELFRNNHPIETGFHSEWLRYNPKGPRGPIPPSVPLGTLGFPWVPLGPPQGIGTLLKRRKGVSRVWWRSGFTGERILGRRHARQRIWI